MLHFLACHNLLLVNISGRSITTTWLAQRIEANQPASLPDRPFHNFRASKSVDWRFLTTESLSISGFRGSKVVKRSVGFLIACCVPNFSFTVLLDLLHAFFLSTQQIGWKIRLLRTRLGRKMRIWGRRETREQLTWYTIAGRSYLCTTQLVSLDFRMDEGTK